MQSGPVETRNCHKYILQQHMRKTQSATAPGYLVICAQAGWYWTLSLHQRLSTNIYHTHTTYLHHMHFNCNTHVKIVARSTQMQYSKHTASLMRRATSSSSSKWQFPQKHGIRHCKNKRPTISKQMPTLIGNVTEQKPSTSEKSGEIRLFIKKQCG